jgi:hypothetical protein
VEEGRCRRKQNRLLTAGNADKTGKGKRKQRPNLSRNGVETKPEKGKKAALAKLA